jgi:uncharacterized protein
MNCPKCNAGMELVKICGIEIDRCTRCKGIWFDQQEQSQIQCAMGSHKADTGHQAIGEYYNAIRDIKCPRCNVPMQEDELKRGRIPIQIETCPKCQGSYFDAGEFREFAEPTILEFARDLFARFTGRSAGNDQ